MSFNAFGKSSGPTAPLGAPPAFGAFPQPPPPPTPPFPNSSVHPQFPTPRTFGAFERGQSPHISTPPFPNSSAHPQFPTPRTFGAFERGQSPPISTLPFPNSSAPSRFPSPRNFGAQDRAQSPLPFDNARLATDPPRPSIAPIRGRWGDKQSSLAGDVGGPIQKLSPPSNPRALGTGISSRINHFQDIERTRSPPVQYTEDFLNPDNDGKEGTAPLQWGDRQSSLSGGIRGTIQKSSPPSGPRDLTRISSKAYCFQDMEKNRSPPIQYDEDFLHPERDGEEGASFSPPKSRSGTGAHGMPKFQNNQRSSLSADAINGGAFAKRLDSHSVSKRNRSPPATTGQVSLTNTYSFEDDAERELQAKAKRLARFKTELDEAKPSGSIQYGSNVAMKKVSSMKTDQSAVEKKKFSGDYPSRSMEDVSQDIDNEDLQSSSVIVGLCPDMCPESERGERERKGDLDRYERLDGDRNQTSKTLAVKKYNRTAEREAELIRPMPILQKTMHYLLGLLDQPYDDRFLRLYNFLWDRMRAIRMDLRMQHIFNLEAITMLEQMIRLHIVAMHELCEFSKGEGFSEGFDAHLNIEQMNKTSVELFQLYDDHRKRGILIPTEKEFRGYYALLKLDKHPGYKVEPAELSLDLAKMTAEIRQTHEVLFARDVARSCRTGNYIAFFRHLRKGSYLQACLMHAHFSKLRTQALASLHSGLLYNQGLPVSQAANWLGMEGEDIESLLEYHGFSIKEFEEPYMVKEGPFLNGDKDYPTRCSKLVHEKKSNTIIKDILSSHQVIPSPYEPGKERRFDKNKKNKQALVQPKQTETLIVPEEVMDIEAVSSPRDSNRVQPAPKTLRSMQVKSPFETPIIGQASVENNHRASVSSPKGNIATPNALASFQSHGMEEQPSSMTPRDSSITVDETPVSNFSVPQFIPDAHPPSFGWATETSYDGLVRSPPGSSPGVIVHSELKATPPHVPVNDGNWISHASKIDYGVASSLQDNALVKVARKEFTDEQLEVKNFDDDDDDASYYDKEVAEAKLKLLIRLWKRRSARKREFREQNRLAANAALSSLSLGPPIRQIKDKHMPYRKFNIDQTVNERQEKLQQSWARWNVSDLVAGKLSEKNANSNCICWKVISFSWFRGGIGNTEGRNPVTHLSLDQWLRYKLIPAQEDETVDDLVLSAPGLSIWSKWVADHSDAITCCLSVVKDVESGNFERKLDGASAVLFPLSETLSWDLQRVELHNLVMCLPAGAHLPLLILSSSSEDNVGEFPYSIMDKLGLHNIDKSRVGSFMVTSLNERERTDQLYGYFSDEKLKEGLLWLASESHPQPVLYDVKMRELVSSHLNICSDALAMMGSDKLGPNQCISVLNEALDRSVSDIGSAAKMNPTGWPCPEVFLLDDSTAEFRAVRLFLPSLGWSSVEEVEPLISALTNCKLPSFSDDISLLNRGCNNMQDFETQRQLLQDSLIRYLTQFGNVMHWMMATKEADVMLKKCTTLELHDTVYKLVPHWELIFRRVFNWQLNRLSSITHKAYVLEEPHVTSNSAFFEKSNFEVSSSHFIVHPSLDEMVEISCSPIVSKRVKSSPKCVQDMSIIASVRSASGVAMLNYFEEEQNQCSPVEVQPVSDSDVYMGENDSQVVPKTEKESDRLSKLLEQCNVLQDEIEKKLSIYF